MLRACRHCAWLLTYMWPYSKKTWEQLATLFVVLWVSKINFSTKKGREKKPACFWRPLYPHQVCLLALLGYVSTVLVPEQPLRA